MSANPLVPVHGSMYAPLYFSTIISTAFYGVTCMQTFFYYTHYHNDPLRIKSLVAAVWISNTIHEALIVSGECKYIMAGLVNRLSLLNGVPELVLQLPFTAMVAVTTQGFFVYRIFVFIGKNMVVPLIWVPLAIYQLGSVLMYVWKALYIADGVHAVELAVLGDRFFMNIATSSLSVAAGADVLIAVFLTLLLTRKRIATGYTSTAHILQRLMVFVVNAGIWTATFAILSLVLLHLYPTNLLYSVFAFPLCSVYCNTLLANLNARAYIRGETTTTHNVDVDLFPNVTSQVSDGTKGDKHPRVVSFRMSGQGGVSLLSVVADQPTTPTSENVWAL